MHWFQHSHLWYTQVVSPCFFRSSICSSLRSSWSVRREADSRAAFASSKFIYDYTQTLSNDILVSSRVQKGQGFELTCRAAAWSSRFSALFLHCSFSLLCFSSSAEYMAFSSVRRDRVVNFVQDRRLVTDSSLNPNIWKRKKMRKCTLICNCFNGHHSIPFQLLS